MAKFKRGDMVVLISGGECMTITGVFEKESADYNSSIGYQAYCQKFGGDSSAFYSCAWFERKAKKEDAFPEESLKIVQ